MAGDSLKHTLVAAVLFCLPFNALFLSQPALGQASGEETSFDELPIVWGFASPSRVEANVGTLVVEWGSAGAHYCSYQGQR